MTTTTTTITVPASRRLHVADRLTEIVRKAAALGATFTVDTREPYEVVVTVDRDGNPLVFPRYEVWERITVTYSPLVLAGGWTLVGVYDRDADGVTVPVAAPGAPEGMLAANLDRADGGDYDACGTTRTRNTVFAVLAADGRCEVVGSTYVIDYLGTDPGRLLWWASVEQEIAEWTDEPAGATSGQPEVAVVRFVAASIAVARRFGYVSRGRATDGNSTADWTTTYLFGRGQHDDEFRQEVGPVLDADVARAEAVVAWAAADDAGSDYMLTLSSIAAREFVTLNRTTGYITSIPAAYQRATEEAAERAAAPDVPAWDAGRQIVEGVVTSAKGYDNAYGTTVKWTVTTDDGRRLWVTCPSALLGTAGPGDRVSMNVTVAPADDDATFAKGSRPAKASIVAAPVTDADGYYLTRDEIVDGSAWRGTYGACGGRTRRTAKDGDRLRRHAPGEVA